MATSMDLEKTRRRRISSTSSAHKEQFAQYLTPVEIAKYMARKTTDYYQSTHREEPITHVSVLDAGAGSGMLSCCLTHELLRYHPGLTVDLAAYELDGSIIDDLNRAYETLAADEDAKGRISSTVYKEDFLLKNHFGLFGSTDKPFDLAIMNPPYKKINSNSIHRRVLRAVGIETVNTYTAFMAIAIKLLAANGILTAIVPRSFCNGLYFLPFRKFLLANTAILHIHSFEARVNAFHDENILQENIIITLKKTTVQSNEVVISHSKDKLFTAYTETRVPFTGIVAADDTQQYIAIPTAKPEAKPRYLPCVYSDVGFDVSTGPIVDFRMKDKLVFDPSKQSIPLLYSVHIRNQKITWPTVSKKPNAILLDQREIEKSAFKSGYYILVKRFSSKEEKRRIYATLLTLDALQGEYFTAENHLNIIHCKHGGLEKNMAIGLTAFLNTEYCDTQFRRFSGHTQVNATDLRNMRYPSTDTLIKFGQLVKGKPLEAYDAILREVL